MSHIDGTSLLNMGPMETNLLNSNNNMNSGGSSTTTTTTPSPATSSSESCPSPMSHSPPGNSNNLTDLLASNNNTLVQSPRVTDKHSTGRSNSPLSTASSASANLNSTPTRQFQGDNVAVPSSPKSNNPDDNNDLNNDAGNTSSDDYSDEIKVYNEEGAADEEQRNSEDLKEEKTEIIKETIEEKPSLSHPFSINNLFSFNNNSIARGASGDKADTSAANPFGANPFAAAAAFGAFNQQRSNLFNPAALYSQELASHFASWWPAAAAGASFNPYRQQFNPFNAFQTAAANYQQQAAAAAVFQAAAASRFSPSLFLPPPPGSGLASPKAEPSAHSASSSASSTSSTSSSSSSSAFSSNPSSQHPSSPYSGSRPNQSMANLSNNNFPNPKHSAKKAKNYENYHQMSNSTKLEQNHHQMNAMHQMNPNQMSDAQIKHHHNMYKHEHMAAPIPNVMVKEKPKKPHVKKPLNAFMLFMKEQRAAVVSECTLRESAAINQILGRKWHELERTEQAKYYEKARLARLEHMQQNPGWSARDNYGLKKKRRRKREKIIGENGELPRKCRARYGLHQLQLWCKPCRRKKKCIRFAGLEENVNGAAMGANGQYGQFSGEVGSGGSMNGGNSEDDYDQYEDDSDESETDDDDDENQNDSGHHHNMDMAMRPNKLPHMMPQHNGSGPGHHHQQHHPGNLMQNHYQQMQPGHLHQMNNQHLLNNHLLMQMNNQRGNGGMPNEIENKALLHHQLQLGQQDSL